MHQDAHSPTKSKDSLPKLDLSHIAKINVVGTSGSGKSHFAEALASRLRYPYVQMDQVFWEPNWTEPADEKFMARLGHAIEQPTWVLDGNFDRTQSLKWRNVDLVIWLDYPLWFTMLRAVRRAVKRIRTGEELWPNTNNRESFVKTFFSRKSILKWTWDTHAKNRERYMARMRDPAYAHIRFLHFTHPRQADSFLKHI